MELLRREKFRMGETADHVMVFEDPLHQVGESTHQAVASAGLRALLVGGGGDADVDGFLRAAAMLDLDLPDARVL